MTKNQWKSFVSYKDELKKIIYESKNLPFYNELVSLQKELIKKNENSRKKYNLENPLVYNLSYEEIKETDEIKVIVVCDNPGFEEQLSKNQKYLIGQSGRIAESYFKKNSEFEIDFRKNVLITNKISIHTGKTADLKILKKMASSELRNYIENLQIKMAEITALLHQNLVKYQDDEKSKPELWLVGYSELKNKGVFELYREKFKSFYQGENFKYWDYVFVYQHFSMNRFAIDLKEFEKEKKFSDSDNLKSLLKELGHLHRDKIFYDMTGD